MSRRGNGERVNADRTALLPGLFATTVALISSIAWRYCCRRQAIDRRGYDVPSAQDKNVSKSSRPQDQKTQQYTI